MPILTDFKLPASPAKLEASKETLFLAFIASNDPATGQSWCPDVRAAMPVLQKTFSSDDGSELAYVEVGQRPEWRDPQNVFRRTWNVNSVPTLARYEKRGTGFEEVGRLVEGEILDSKQLKALLVGGSA